MASDMISSKKLIDAIKSMRVVFGGEDVFPDHVKNSVILAINLQPAVDAVEVVRCKDCERRTQSCGMVLHCSLNGIQVDDDDFCSYGKRVKKDAVD